MLKLLHRIRQLFRRRPPASDLTVIEYEAVSLIAYEERGSRQSTASPEEAKRAAGSGQRSPLRSPAGQAR
jgi:hypothetical protein